MIFFKKNTLNSTGQNFNVKIIPFIVFLSITLLMIVLNIIFSLLIPQKDSSQLTKPTFKSFSDGSYFNFLNGYYSDNFLFSNHAKSFTNTLKSNLGIDMIDNIFITDNRLIYNTQIQNTTTAYNNSKSISRFIDNTSQNIKCYFGLIPTASEIYKNELPMQYNTLNESKFISNIYSEISNSTIDIFSTLSSQKNNSIYYNSDSNLTSLGGYYVYSCIATAMNKSVIPISSFDVEHIYNNYLGNLYQQILVKPKLIDSIDLFHYNGFNVVDKVVKYSDDEKITTDSIFFKNNLNSKNKLDIFLGNSVPKIDIQTNNIASENILIFKDDFCDNILQFLPLHFSNITLVDLELISNEDLKSINLQNFDSILFLYNVDTFNNGSFISSKLEHLL